MQEDFVIVTSLYNLTDVKRGDNRSWDDYLEWFGKTLQVKCPFIIFTEENIVPFVKESRGDLLTHIITTKLEEVPLYPLKDLIQNILDSSNYQEQMSDINRVECKDSLYSVIQYSKFKWLRKSSELNPFNSKYFFWLDAGASRFLEEFDYENVYPSKESLEQLELIDNTFLIQYNADYYTDLINSKNLSEEYFWDNRSFVCGSMFGGNSKSIVVIDSEMDKVMNLMIEKFCINNEQIALGYLCKNKEELFTTFYRKDPQKHLNLFEEMA
jgi:hypothetical protein